jgi:hypothetical protein
VAKKDKAVTKNVSDFNVSIFDNGYTLNYSGNNDEGDWTDAKLIVSDIDKLCELIRNVVTLPKD